MAVVAQILEWSRTRPMWQRDALRRLVVVGEISANDIVELTAMLQAAKGIPVQPPPAVPDPLAETHIAIHAGDQGAVHLESLSNLVNVNALAAAQTLSFALEGLTVIYGDNGSGKSGYARLLKQICRARAPGSGIKPNVFGAGVPTPSGTIRYRVGNDVLEAAWQEGTAPPSALGSVSVFDSKCASVYVEQKTEVAYRPLGLDMLSKLAQACDLVKARLHEQLGSNAEMPLPVGQYAPSGEVGKLLTSLKTSTSAEEIDKLASLSEVEHQRLVDLRSQIAQIELEEPSKRSAELRRQAQRFKALAYELSRIDRGQSLEIEQTLRRAAAEAVDTAAAAEIASSLSFKDEPLPTVGTPAWKKLWDAARDYSTREVYVQQPFPNSGPGARCVLCQQPLADDAKDRFARFERFVQDRTQVDAKVAAQQLLVHRRALEAVTVVLLDETVLQEIGEEETPLRIAINIFLQTAAARKTCLLSCLEKNEWTDLPTAIAAPSEGIFTAAALVEKQAADHDAAAQPTQKLVLQRELADLEERQWLVQVKPQVLATIERLVFRQKLLLCANDTDTGAITRKSTELTKSAVSDALCATFDAELKSLGLAHLSVVLDQSGGAKGTLYHRVEIRGPGGQSVTGVQDVLSEGEQRCIALAAFLAELSTQSAMSGIVLDDPVSSLDHQRREAIARRLVTEAKRRPVIVLTHDLTFLVDLQEQCRRLTVPCATRHLWREPDAAGMVENDLPWAALSVKKRFGLLRSEWQRLDKEFRVGSRIEYAHGVGLLYGRLRQAWERAVEEVLFNGTVQRFARGVKTQSLEHVDVLPTDYAPLDDGMSKCSTYMIGHDAPDGANPTVPTPDEVTQDIEALQTWIDTIRARRA